MRAGASTVVVAVFLVACGDGVDDWDGVRNPLLGFDDAAIKDAYLVHDGDTWHLGYSRATADPFRFQLGFASSPNLRDFTIGDTLDQPDTGGLASPTVVRAPDGRWLMTYNSHTRDIGDSLNKLYYRTSDDLATWSAATRIHIDGVDDPSERLIDAAVAFTDTGAYLFFKRDQIANVAYAASGSIDGPWTLLGELSQRNLENLQPILIDGTWHLLGTTIPLVHDAVLHRLDGDPTAPASWRNWTVVRTLTVEEQSWNTGPLLDHERSNAAFLVDDRPADGYFYLLYAGSTDLTSFEGRGHAKLGLARSRDLQTWDAAPER
ncbi:MAG TPA: hypothetical protein VMZ53_21545 [Kofleriaceae bacterium]|nr:hypothetical protein [Kofleriaceae bacterium]